MFSRVAKEGFLKDLFDDLKKDDDVLVQLNSIEIVSNLAESKQGFEYLHSLEILTQMDTRLNQVSSGNCHLSCGDEKSINQKSFHIFN